jgi:hypothetical protein
VGRLESTGDERFLASVRFLKPCLGVEGVDFIQCVAPPMSAICLEQAQN